MVWFEHGGVTMFNQRLKALREESGMKQKEFADKIGISPRVYSYYENNRFPKDTETIKKIAEFFGCTSDYLLGISEFRNHEEAQKIRESAELLKQIEDTQALENLKDILNTLAEIGSICDQTTYPVTNTLNTMVHSMNEMISSYRSSLEAVGESSSQEMKNLKFFEFKAFSTEKIDLANESIKAMANELANRIKNNSECHTGFADTQSN